MDISRCYDFAQALEIEQLSLAVDDEAMRTGWVRGRCPMGWLHAKGYDRSPSFGICGDSNNPSYWHCFAHGGGSLVSLINAVTWHNKVYYEDACEIYSLYELPEREDEGGWPEHVDWCESDFLVKRLHEPIPEKYLHRFKKIFASSAAVLLLADRDIELSTARYFDIRVSAKHNAMIFPIRGMNNKLYCMRARALDGKHFFEVTADMMGAEDEFPGLFRSGAMFGLDRADLTKPVMIVESELEAMRVHTLGFQNVVATSGGVKQSQLQNLVFPTMYLAFDADEAGRKSEATVIQRCSDKGTLYVVDWSSVGITDPGELEDAEHLSEALQKKEVV